MPGSRKIVLVALVVLALIGAVAVAGVLWFLMQGSEELTPPVVELLDVAESGDYAAAYALTGTAWRNAQSEEQFAGFLGSLMDLLGERRELSMETFRLAASPGKGRKATVLFHAVYEHDDDVTIRATLMKEDGVWRVVGLYFESELLTQNTVCPECGALISARARYCSQCGKRLVPEETP